MIFQAILTYETTFMQYHLFRNIAKADVVWILENEYCKENNEF